MPSAGDRLDAVVPARFGADLVRGVAEHQCRDALGVQCRQPLRDQPADREADDHASGDAEMIEQRDEIGDVVGHRIGRARRLREPVAALVVAHDAGSGRRAAPRRRPRCGNPCRANWRRPAAAGRGAAGLVVQDDAVEARECHARLPMFAGSVPGNGESGGSIGERS